jgi:hypothetical protein
VARHQPNVLQKVFLKNVIPSPENVRLFVEHDRLEDLLAIYGEYAKGREVILPDPPILRFRGRGKPLEILAGERRVTAAVRAGVKALPCRIVKMSDEDAYRFIVAHNTTEALTTAELAFRAAEMDRLGFTYEEIGETLNGVSAGRYVEVGQMLTAEMFTDEKKHCDPSIIEWWEAAQHGQKHFHRCFRAWDAGLWDGPQCSRNFRRREDSLPIDNAERGIRVTFNGNRLVIRGQINLDYISPNDALQMLAELGILGYRAADAVRTDHDFGPREVIQINPDSTL